MTPRVRVDWTVCKGRGVCAELLPERITLDEWGFPLIDPSPIPPGVLGFARRAVTACPTRALSLTPADPSAPGGDR